jgi:hypothetical protein
MGCTASEMPSESSSKRWYALRQVEISMSPSDVGNGDELTQVSS